MRQQEILDEIKQYALYYTQNLPNFICLQVTRHYVDPNAGDHFRIIGTINAQLGYNQGQEHYKIISVNGKLQDTNISMDDVGTKIGGASSTGEFGSLMQRNLRARKRGRIRLGSLGNSARQADGRVQLFHR